MTANGYRRESLRNSVWVAVALTCGLGAVCRANPADQWPQFRGPGTSGLAVGEGYATEWDAQRNVRWKVEVPGEGWAQPVVWGDTIFIATAVPQADAQPQTQPRPGGRGRHTPPDTVYSWQLHALDLATGKTRWKKVAREARPPIPKHRSNTYASETPVTDGRRVYVYFGMVGLFCYDFDGNPLWDKSFGAYPMRNGWGTSSSPALHDGRLYLQVDNEQRSFLVALDAETGDELWRKPRTEKTNWSSPMIWRNKRRAELVAMGAVVRSYDPVTGEPLWRLDLGGGRCNATPVGDAEHLYLGNELRNNGGPEDGGGGLFAVKAGAAGDITPARGRTTSAGVAWSRRAAGVAMASPLLYRGRVYALDRRSGLVSCYDARTGEPAFRKARIAGARSFWASPWAYDGKVFCLDSNGATHVLAAGPEFKVIASNPLGDECWASPALARGSILIRSAQHLYRIQPSP